MSVNVIWQMRAVFEFRVQTCYDAFKREATMRYRPSYGDKQREAQRRKKKEREAASNPKTTPGDGEKAGPETASQEHQKQEPQEKNIAPERRTA